MVFRNDNSIRKFLTEDGHRSMQWQILLPRSRLGPGQKHCFDEKSLRKVGISTMENVVCFICEYSDWTNFPS